MKRYLWITALFCLLLPGLVTYLWFYSGPSQTASPAMPDYSNIDFPKPALSTEMPIPLSPKKPGITVLLDLQHQNQYSLSEIDPLVRYIEAYGGSIQITSEQTILDTSLKSADVYISITPIMRFTQQEITQVNHFVDRGGKLVVITDPTRNSMSAMPMMDTGGGTGTTMLSGTDNANLLLEPFDIAFADDYLYNMVENEGNFRNVLINDLVDHDLTGGIEQLVIYGGHSVTSGGKQLAKTGGNTLSSTNEGDEIYSVMDIVESGDGSVIAIGDLSLITSEYVLSSDNQVFVKNLAKFITSDPREKTLLDFPALFNGDIVLQPAGKMDVSGDLISSVSNLESYFQLPSGSLTISKTDSYSTNRIVLSTFAETKTTADILKELKINLAPRIEDDGEDAEETPDPTATPSPMPSRSPEMMEDGPVGTTAPDYERTMEAYFGKEDEADTGPEIIEVPYFDRIKTKDLGLVGLPRAGHKTTLIVMAASPSKIQAFIRSLAISGLSGCVVHDDLAACKVTDFAVPPQG